MSGRMELGPARRPPLWRLPAVRRLLVLALLGFSSFFLTLAALPSWAVRVGVPAGSAGLVTAAMMTSTVLVQLAVPALTRRLGLARVLALGLVLLGGPAPAYLLSRELAWLLAISALRGCGFAVLTVLGTVMAERVAPATRRGESLGLLGLAIAAPSLLAVPAGVALTLSGRFGWVAVLAGAAVFGTGYGAVLNLSLLAAFARAGPGAATTASSVWNAAFDIGLGAGALAVGAVASAGLGLGWTGLGLGWTAVACAAAILATVPLAVRSSPRADARGKVILWAGSIPAG